MGKISERVPSLSPRHPTHPLAVYHISAPSPQSQRLEQAKSRQNTFKVEHVYTSYATLSSDIPWNIPRVTCIFLVYARALVVNHKTSLAKTE